MRNNIPIFKRECIKMIEQYSKSVILASFTFQNTWAGAMRVCRSIGTELLAVEYDDKDTCIAKLAKSNNFFSPLKLN